MLLPYYKSPSFSIYYNAYLILKLLNECKCEISTMDLYKKFTLNSSAEFPLYLLSLEWLYVMGAISVNDKNVIKVCS